MKVSSYSKGDSIPNGGILLIRHGPKRKRIHPLEQTPLSENGIKQVIQFAKAWDGPIPSRVLTSPIDRCAQTASIIIETNDWKQGVQHSRLLGDPGPFVIDSEVVSGQLKGMDEHRTMGFFREHIDGAIKPGMASLAEGSVVLLEELVSTHRDGLVLAVSHDVIISALAAHLGINDKEWPEPLCGIAIRF